MKRLLAIAAVLAVCSAPAFGEMEKIANVACNTNKICFYIWPNLAPLPGWHRDEEVNFRYGFNALIPDGFTFSKAAAILYANAIDKERYIQDNPTSLDIAGFIADDKATFVKNNPDDLVIAEALPLTTADGIVVPTITFFRAKDKNFERVGYYEEDGFFVTFVINARSEADLAAAMPMFEAMVKTYRK